MIQELKDYIAYLTPQELIGAIEDEIMKAVKTGDIATVKKSVEKVHRWLVEKMQ
jgi:hypothetical protein